MPGYHPRKDRVLKKKKNHIQQKNKVLFIYLSSFSLIIIKLLQG